MSVKNNKLVLKGDLLNAVATKTATIPQAIIILEEEIKALGDLTEREFKTTGVHITNVPESLNIKDETSKERLTSIFSVILAKSEAYWAAQTELGLEVKQFKHGGFTLEEWKHDILLRVAQIDHHQNYKDKVEERDTLKTFISEEEKKADALKKFFERRS